MIGSSGISCESSSISIIKREHQHEMPLLTLKSDSSYTPESYNMSKDFENNKQIQDDELQRLEKKINTESLKYEMNKDRSKTKVIEWLMRPLKTKINDMDNSHLYTKETNGIMHTEFDISYTSPRREKTFCGIQSCKLTSSNCAIV